MPLSLMCTQFAHGDEIPARYTCEGEDVSPPLAWMGAPAGTKSFALIVDDPDAPDPANPQRTWVHWVLYNVPHDVDDLPEAMQPRALPPNAREGLNDWERTGWGGPCPPIGRHRYFFKLYALSSFIPDLPDLTAGEVESAMEGRVLEQAELIGTYQKKKKGGAVR
ncbi:MAG: YbhB/YbcL family Raf kinase inhibitor-like protein [Gemmatimonadota bacterium]